MCTQEAQLWMHEIGIGVYTGGTAVDAGGADVNTGRSIAT